MIYCSFNADGSVAIKDVDNIRKFDKFGNDVSKSLSMKDMSGFMPYKAVSVLTSLGTVRVGVFDTQLAMVEYEGTLNTLMNLVMRGGFIRRIMCKGTDNGISYTQVIFLYSQDCNLGDISTCL